MLKISKEVYKASLFNIIKDAFRNAKEVEKLKAAAVHFQKAADDVEAENEKLVAENKELCRIIVEIEVKRNILVKRLAELDDKGMVDKAVRKE